MKVFAYYLRSESGDELLRLTDKDYKNAIEFMKNEFSEEYEAQKEQQEFDGFEFDENDIPYDTFLKDEKEYN